MTDKTEGVIQYQLVFTRQPLDTCFSLEELETCRSRLYALQLVGQSPALYEGLGYGNISQRVDVPGLSDTFLVTGSQTGHLPVLGREHYALVTSCSPVHNRLHASGEIQPSSESMTHAVIYQTLPKVKAVIHVHSAYLWQNAQKKGWLVTSADITYGTPEMAEAVQHLLLTNPHMNQGMLVMLGHEDGVVAWGETLTEAETLFTQALQD